MIEEKFLNWTNSLSINIQEVLDKCFTCTSSLKIDPEEIKRSLFSSYKISNKLQIMYYTSDYNCAGTMLWVI